MQRRELEGLSREELIARAERLRVSRPRVLTQAELVDEIVSRSARSERERAKERGWLGRARDLLASVVERGLHLPEAARALGARPRAGGGAPGAGPPRSEGAPPPLPTVTLAEIYAAQGHLDRAVGVLDEVLSREPDHDEAKRLRERLADQRAKRGPAASPGPAHAGAEAASAAISAGSPQPELDDAALPERYDVDEVVAIAVDPQTVYLYWEVRPTTLARARSRRPDGRLAVRVVCVSPSWDGPAVETREVPIDALYGDVFVRDVTPGSNVRVSVGWLGRSEGDGDFEPFAVGDELAAPRLAAAETLGQAVARWSPDPARGGAAATRQVFGTAAHRMRQRVGAEPISFAGNTGAAAAAGAAPGAQAAGGPWAAGVAPSRRVIRHETSRRVGSSELVRGFREDVLELGAPPGAGRGPGARGGASELSRGGASELGRRQRSL